MMWLKPWHPKASPILGLFLKIMISGHGLFRSLFMSLMLWLVGGLEHFLFFHILGMVIPIDKYVWNGMKPPTSLMLNQGNGIKTLSSCHTARCFALRQRKPIFSAKCETEKKSAEQLMDGLWISRWSLTVWGAYHRGYTWISSDFRWFVYGNDGKEQDRRRRGTHLKKHLAGIPAIYIMIWIW